MTERKGGLNVYQLAEKYTKNTNRCLFITGKAGTGKTTFLKQLKENSLKNMAVVAPTGVAAINAGGMTIHSFFQLPLRTFIPTQASYKQLFAEQRMSQRRRNMLYQLELLVIDEVSMVRADVLDAIDVILRHYRYKHHLPFGGVQVVMIGDLLQLPPVVVGSDEENLKRYYDGPYFFNSKVMSEVKPLYIEFDTIFRQQNQQFINLLNEIRNNHLSDEGRTLLYSRYLPNFVNTEDDFHITLTTHNNQADNINNKELSEISEKSYTFIAEINDIFPQNSYPTNEKLVLKKGARVMFVRNDDQSPRRFYNGKLGIVSDIASDFIKVDCDDGVIDVPRMVWKNVVYKEDTETGKIIEETIGSFEQYPLRLAWAITIHKSQGLTFDRVILDAARAFACGQVYVALSRCRTLEGLVLSSPIHHLSFQNDQQVLGYINVQPTANEIALWLSAAEKEYRTELFIDLYSFNSSLELLEQIQRHVSGCVSFNAETNIFLTNLSNEINSHQRVLSSFQLQLRKLIESGDEVHLQERLKASAGYFTPILTDLVTKISSHPCRSKNKADTTDFDSLMGELFVYMWQKVELIKALAINVSTHAYFYAKSHITPPDMKVQSSYEKPSTVKREKQQSTKKSKKSSSKSEQDTYEITYSLFLSGKSIEEIAEERNLTIETIYKHLTRYVQQGHILLNKIVPSDIINQILSAFIKNPDMTTAKEVYSALNETIPYHYIRTVIIASHLISSTKA